MRPQKVLDTEILVGLAKVFRSKGYEGASLKELAEATGLKKASLYHRFPNGKKEMAEAVLYHIDNWVESNVFQALDNKEVPPQSRLENGITQIRKLYNGGKEVCIFRALSMQAGLDLFSEQINNGMNQWITAFHKVGMALGLTTPQAQANAVQTLIEIQGSLIVAKGVDDITVFEKTLKNIEKRYLDQ